MFLIYIVVYTIFLALLWWLFIVTKIHSYKFKNFSDNIQIVTTFLFIFLIILSLVWYSIIIFWTKSNNSSNVNSSWGNYTEVDY